MENFQKQSKEWESKPNLLVFTIFANRVITRQKQDHP